MKRLIVAVVVVGTLALLAGCPQGGTSGPAPSAAPATPSAAPATPSAAPATKQESPPVGTPSVAEATPAPAAKPASAPARPLTPAERVDALKKLLPKAPEGWKLEGEATSRIVLGLGVTVGASYVPLGESTRAFTSKVEVHFEHYDKTHDFWDKDEMEKLIDYKYSKPDGGAMRIASDYTESAPSRKRGDYLVESTGKGRGFYRVVGRDAPPGDFGTPGVDGARAAMLLFGRDIDVTALAAIQ